MSRLDPDSEWCQGSGPCTVWPIELKLTHLEWKPEATLIHFQGHYLTMCELDYSTLQVELQNTPKMRAAVDVGELCLVEDLMSGRWYRGRVQNRNMDKFDVYLIDYGNVMSVDMSSMFSCSNAQIFNLPPKIVCGFFANVLPIQEHWDPIVEKHLSSLMHKSVTVYIHALLPYKVLIVEAPDINKDLVRLGFGKHVDTDTFLLLVEMLTEVPLKQNMEPVPDLIIEKHRGQELFFKPSSMKGLEDILSFCGPKMSPGTCVKLKVTAAVNPGLFYCQLTSMASDLEAMSVRLAAACESTNKDQNKMPQENLGLLCSVKGKDAKWYRGFVQSLPINFRVRVFFIDYGFWESVRVEDILRLPPDFLSMPIVAFPCALSSVTEKDKEQLCFLKKGILGGVLNAKIFGRDEQNIYSIEVLGNKDSSVKGPELNRELSKLQPGAVLKWEQMLSQGGYLCYDTVMALASCSSVQAENLEAGSKFVGYVECVTNANHFWLRTQTRNGCFEDMMKGMSEHFSQLKLNEEVLESPQLGMMCCAMYEKDMHFYRAIVTAMLDYGAEVLFIDFGNKEKVPYNLIKKIPETFGSQAPFALCCTLVNVIPMADVWTDANTKIFRQAVSNRSVLVHVIHLRKDKVVVDLFDSESKTGQSITELLISLKQAEYTLLPPVKLNKHNILKSNKNTTNKPQTFRARTQNQNTIPKNEEVMAVQTKILQADDTPTQEVTPRGQDPITIKTLTLKLGCEMPVQCTHINCPSDFWCQLPDKLPALDRLMADIQLYYSTHTVPLQVDAMFCIAKSPEEGRWYRACITGREGTGQICILLVDFGTTLQVTEHNLQAILPEHSELEAQAFRCSLYNIIEPTGPKICGDWSPEACTTLRVFARDNAVSLKCSMISFLKVAGKGLYTVVDLHSAQTQSITNVMIGQGLARRVEIRSERPSYLYPGSFTYSSFNLSCGNEELVYVTHVDSPWKIYCQSESNSNIFEALETKISEEMKTILQEKNWTRGKKMCLAKHIDGNWYRGLAQPVQSALHLAVFFVDYGNISIVEKTNILSIPNNAAELLYTPMQAVRCSLAHVPKNELFAGVKKWLEETLLNKLVRAVVVGKLDNGLVTVELFDEDVHINGRVNELIASLTPSPKKVASIDTGSKLTKMKQRYYPKVVITQKKDRSRQQKRPSPTLTQSSASRHILTARRCLHQANRSCSVSSKPEKYNITKKQQLGEKDATQKLHQASGIAEMPTPSCLPHTRVKPGLRALCYTSHINTVHNFFLQLQEDEADILKMKEDLKSNLMERILGEVRLNDLILAEYEEDGTLYRAIVKGYEGSDSFKVEFLDYGNFAVVTKDNIYSLTSNIYSLTSKSISQPRLCIPCSLIDTSSYENADAFITALMEKPLSVDFVSQIGSQWKVKIEILGEKTCFPVSPDSAAGPSCVPHKQQGNTSSFKTKETPEPSCHSDTVETSQERYKSDGKQEQSRITQTPESAEALLLNLRGAILPIQALDMEQGTLLSVLQNGCFYVRLERTGDMLATLENLIAVIANEAIALPKENVKDGLRCSVKAHKGKWSRAVVEHVDQDECWTLLLDHGLTKETTFGSIRQLNKDLAQIPALAVLCKLNTPLSVTKQYALESLVGKDVKLLFITHSKSENLWLVEIVLTEMLLLQQAVMTTSKQHLDQINQMPRGTEKLEITTDESQQEPTTPVTNPTQQLSFAPINIGRMYNAFSSAITNPFHFYIALDDLLLINTVFAMLEELPNEMPPLPEAQLVPGSCCLVHLDTKNKWCRTEVVHAAETIVMNLVDYSHYMDLVYKDHHRLKILPEALQRLPKTTFLCSLQGVNPVPNAGHWTNEAAVYFQERLSLKNLQIVFRELVSVEHWEVDILVDGIHVAKELVDAGHACYIDMVLGLSRFQEQHPCNVPLLTASSGEDRGQEEHCLEEYWLNRGAPIESDDTSQRQG